MFFYMYLFKKEEKEIRNEYCKLKIVNKFYFRFRFYKVYFCI